MEVEGFQMPRFLMMGIYTFLSSICQEYISICHMSALNIKAKIEI